MTKEVKIGLQSGAKQFMDRYGEALNDLVEDSGLFFAGTNLKQDALIYEGELCQDYSSVLFVGNSVEGTVECLSLSNMYSLLCEDAEAWVYQDGAASLNAAVEAFLLNHFEAADLSFLSEGKIFSLKGKDSEETENTVLPPEVEAVLKKWGKFSDEGFLYWADGLKTPCLVAEMDDGTARTFLLTSPGVWQVFAVNSLEALCGEGGETMKIGEDFASAQAAVEYVFDLGLDEKDSFSPQAV